MADNGDKEQFKFAILHICHYTEIALKYAVHYMHPLLVYKKPFSGNLKKEMTITSRDALFIIKNCAETDSLEQTDLSHNDINMLNIIKRTRNSIEHYRFEFSSKEVRFDIQFLLSVIDDILTDICKSPISEALETKEFNYYSDLMESFELMVNE